MSPDPQIGAVISLHGFVYNFFASGVTVQGLQIYGASEYILKIG